MVVAVGAVLAEGGEGEEGDVGFAVVDALPAEAEGVERAGRGGFDDDVAPVDEAVEDGCGVGRGEVEGEAALVGVEPEEGAGAFEAGMPSLKGGCQRRVSPWRGSILRTSAPKSAQSLVA